MIGRNDPCWCGSGKKWKKCCAPTQPPMKLTEELRKRYKTNHGIILKNKEQIAGITRACQLAADILMKVCAKAKAGVTTNELNLYSEELCKEAGAIAAALNYGNPPFPKSICLSLNDVICHGIADDRPLEEGDIMNVDVAVILDGYYGDCSKMVQVGEVSEEKKRVCDAAYHCLMNSVALCKPGLKLHEIGDMICDTAESMGCSVVYQFVGHGVGIDFHEEPQVSHFRNKSQTELAPGMTFTIEPMINAGLPDAELDEEDGWTARTPDGKPSAQFEHTLLITEAGHEILTPWTRQP